MRRLQPSVLMGGSALTSYRRSTPSPVVPPSSMSPVDGCGR
jgi:hypothetical protein